MSASGIGAVATPQLSPAAQSAQQHRHRVHASSSSDLETQNSSAASAGPAGSKVDIKV
jgi:hypothetical protein